MSTIKVDTIATRTGSGNITVSNDTAFSGDLTVNTDTIFADASADKVGINTTAMDASLEVNSASSKINTLTVKTAAGSGGVAGIGFMAGQTTAGREKAAIFFKETNGGAHYTGDIVFAVASSSGNATQVAASDEVFRVRPTGIAIGGTGDANTLDDYEEGTWTPGIASRGFSGVVKGSYTKIGRLVTVYFDCNTMTGGNITNPSLTGLPFTSTNSVDFQYAAFIPISEPYGLAGSYSYVYFRIDKNATGGIMLQGGGNGSSITHASGVTMSNDDHFRGMGQYYAD